MKTALMQLGLGLLLLTCPLTAASATSRQSSESADIRLVVILAVDQLRADYLERFKDGFKGGFALLTSRGVTFSQGYHGHAVTSTGPGHATIATGTYPNRSGIVGNQWYEKDGTKQVYCVGDDRFPVLFMDGSQSKPEEGRSPRNLLVTGFGDWLKEAYPQARVVSASRKDRAAVLMGGKHPDGAFWYDTGTGDFVTSEFYEKELPDWLIEFNKRRIPDQSFGELWTPLPFTGKALEAGIVLKRETGWFESGFPHAIGTTSPVPNSAFYSDFGGTPFMDDYLGELAKTLIKVYELGQDEQPDYLGLSFSVLDSVGHAYGPHSPESLDTLLRLDLTLGRVFESLDEVVGLEHVAFALTADHGVMDLPEYRRAMGDQGFRLSAEDIACVQRQGKAFVRRYGADEDWFLHGSYLDYSDIGRHNLKREQVEHAAAEALAKCRHIRKVWTRTELEGPPAGDDPFEELFRRSYYPGRSPDLAIQYEKFFLPSSGTGTTHGSPYDYDAHVPIVFLIPGTDAARIPERVETVDIAPTLADLLDIVPPCIDGGSLLKRFSALSKGAR